LTTDSSVKFRAARESEAIFTISLNNQELHVKGQEFDHVKNLPLGDLAAYRNAKSWGQIIESWRISCSIGLSLTTYPTGESIEEALWRTFCWNIDYQKWNPAIKDIVTTFRNWRHLLESTNTDSINMVDIELLSQDNSFTSIINMTSPLCTTSNGYLAAVPYTTEIGDCIAILAGGGHPFVLRPTGDHYRLVGPCYVHGIMNGEAFPEQLDELKWFSIR
jgi:hypothetical protein